MSLATINKKIAVMLPVDFPGGTFRGAKLIAEAIALGSQIYNEPVDVVFAHLDNPQLYPEAVFHDLPKSIPRRIFQWRILNTKQAEDALLYAGHSDWTATEKQYIVPDDGINYFMDCDLWLIVSDRLTLPLLPIRPYVLMVYDYIQRHLAFIPKGYDAGRLRTARLANRVLVTTDFAGNDAIQYAGVKPSHLRKVPFLMPLFTSGSSDEETIMDDRSAYFIWTTNRALHKNHENAFKALLIYYEKLNGGLSCHVTGVGTDKLLESSSEHLVKATSIYNASFLLKKQVHFFGEILDQDYRIKLKNAVFLWHTAQTDNGTFCVVEATQLGTPSLSSDYPAMREIAEYFDLDLQWMNWHDPEDMAIQLKLMEDKYRPKEAVAENKTIKAKGMDYAAGEYWKVIRECL